MKRDLAFASLVLAGAAACSSSSGPRTHQVAIRDMQFTPAELTVAVGDTIVWTNDDLVPHTVTSKPPGTFDSTQLDSHAQWRYVVTAAGAFPYVCTYHPTMHGTITAR
jgi:plastocyanin